MYFWLICALLLKPPASAVASLLQIIIAVAGLSAGACLGLLASDAAERCSTDDAVTALHRLSSTWSEALDV